MKNRIVAVVGMCGAGKSEVVKVFEKAGYKKVYFGDATFDEIKRRGLEVNWENEKKVREDLRASGDMAIYAKLNLPKIESLYNSGENVVVESMYSWSEYKELKNKFGDDFYVVSVMSNLKVRESRLSVRDVRPMTKEDIKNRDYSEIENIEKGGPIGRADFYILNNFDMDRLRQDTKEIIWHLDSID